MYGVPSLNYFRKCQSLRNRKREFSKKSTKRKGRTVCAGIPGGLEPSGQCTSRGAGGNVICGTAGSGLPTDFLGSEFLAEVSFTAPGSCEGRPFLGKLGNSVLSPDLTDPSCPPSCVFRHAERKCIDDKTTMTTFLDPLLRGSASRAWRSLTHYVVCLNLFFRWSKPRMIVQGGILPTTVGAIPSKWLQFLTTTPPLLPAGTAQP